MDVLKADKELTALTPRWTEGEELIGLAVSALGVRSRKISNFRKGQSSDR
jgi:hypothetical protein